MDINKLLFGDFLPTSILVPGSQRPNFQTFKEAQNRFQGINSDSLCLAPRKDNSIITRFLAPHSSVSHPSTLRIGASRGQHRARVVIHDGLCTAPAAPNYPSIEKLIQWLIGPSPLCLPPRTAQRLPDRIQMMFGRAVFIQLIVLDDINAKAVEA